VKKAVLILSAIVLAALALSLGAKTPTTRPMPAIASLSPEVDEIVVDFKDDVDPAEIARVSSQLHIDLHWNSVFSAETRLTVARVPRARMASVLEALAQNPEVESAEPNYVMHGLWDPKEIVSLDALTRTHNKPNDPLYKYQWHLHKIDVEKAWTASQGKGVVVAVIDTGVAYEDYDRFHQVEDLKQTRFVKGYNFVAGNEHANDDHAHGTHVAGTIAQSTNNGIGVAGVAPEAVIMPIKVLSARGSGKISDIAEGIRFAANHGAKVINMSLGGPVPSSALESAVKYAYKKGVVIVCAAGNSNSENVSYPARYPECIAVSATRFDDQLTFYTNRGKRIDIAAPGGDMNVDQNDDGYKDGVLQNTIGIMDPTTETYALFQGTSMAAPHVAGAAALLIANGITRPDAVKARLQETARKDGLDLDKGYGAGVLDAGRAAVKTALLDPLARLVLAVLVFGVILAVSPTRPRFSIMTALGMVMGSAGLFFLPWLGVPAPSIMTQPVPNWDLGLAGVNAHANALFWSALIPFALSVCTFGERRLQALCMGLSIGMGAFLLHQTLYLTADIQGVPWLLARVWLLANVGGCFFLAYVLGFSPRPENRGEARGQRGERKVRASVTAR
jgi:serine protease